MFTPTLALIAMVSAALAGSASPFPTGIHVERTDVATMSIHGEERIWSFSGTARYMSDITGNEKSMYVGGIIDAATRGEALKMAREAGQAQAARRGRVISVHIRSLW